MADKEFLDFLQKQRDFEDELKQREQQEKTAIWRKMPAWAKGEAAKKGMTFENCIAWIESSPKCHKPAWRGSEFSGSHGKRRDGFVPFLRLDHNTLNFFLLRIDLRLCSLESR